MMGGQELGRSFLQDLRFGFRMLRRSPGFSLLAILCLTLGIGANAAVFSWVEGILFRPYPAVAHQQRLFALGGTARGKSGGNGTFHGRTSLTCGGAAHHVRSPSSARLPAAR